MSKIILILSSFLLLKSVYVESVYTHMVTTINGVAKPLSAYQGKKILIVTLPITQNSSNDSFLHSLDSIRAVYTSSLVIIATPSYEDGYTEAIKDSLKIWYESILQPDIIITEGEYTRKSSGNLQNTLFRWLTDKDKNGFFNQDISGPKDKFIIWTNGELTGVLGAQSRIGGNAMNNLLQGQ